MDKVFQIYSEDYSKNIEKLDFIVVYDTSALLDLYRLSPDSKKDVIELLERISSRIGHIVPHYVVMELNKNKAAVRNDTLDKLTEIRAKFKTFKKSLTGVSKVSGYSTPLHQLSVEINDSIQKIEVKLSKNLQKNSYKDELYSQIAYLFNGRVSEPLSKEMLVSIMKEGDVRMASGMPPGFKDSGKKDFLNYYGMPIDSKYGDIIIWKEVIDISRKHKKNIVLISSDQKSDWQDDNGLRPDLALEFNNDTDFFVYMLTLGNFAKIFKDKLSRELTESTSNELADIECQHKNWLDEVLDAFENLGGIVKLTDVYNYIETNTDRSLPENWKSTIRRTIYNHSSDVNAYLGRKDIFEKVSSGRWKLRI